MVNLILKNLKIGDYVLFILALIAVISSFSFFWQAGVYPEEAVIIKDGQLFAQVNLRQSQLISVPGELGVTIVEINNGQARIASDPGVRQYCVQQGWLKRVGEIAICAPSHLSLQIVGRVKLYDSLGY